MTIYRTYKNNLYIRTHAGYSCVGLNYDASGKLNIPTIGAICTTLVDHRTAINIQLMGKPCDPPWRDRSTKNE